MFRNYFKIAVRNLAKNKLFSAINIIGLSVGMASCLLLFLYANQELNYDSHHGKRIYRITSTFNQLDAGEEMVSGTSSVPIGPAVAAQIPEILNSARITGAAILNVKDMISYDGQQYFVENGMVGDSTIFDIFNYRFIEGEANNPMPHNNAVVLEKKWAEKLFGQEVAYGKMLKISTALGESDYEVTAVYDASAYDTHLAPTFVISTNNNVYKQFFDRMSAQWVSNNLVFTYLELAPDADPIIVDQKIHQIFLENGAKDMKEMGFSKTMDLQPVAEIHTSAGFQIDSPNKTSLVFIQVLVLIGVLILLLACVNYINLATAQAGRRSLEVGVRKVMGVSSRGLISQFLGESFILVFISLLLSLVLAELVLPYFNMLVNNPIALDASNIGIVLTYMGIFLVAISLLAGFYPAFYLSSFKPVSVLKGRSKDNAGAVLVRKVLVVLQFVISIVLISSIIIISQQVDYIKNKELGFETKSKLVIPLRTEEAINQYSALKQKFGDYVQVKSVSGANTIPGSPIINDILVYKSGQSMDDAVHIYSNVVDYDYLQVLGIELTEGAYFPETYTDTIVGAVMINKSAALSMGFEEGSIAGEIIYFDWQGQNYSFKVMGVFEDINQFSLHESDNPLLFQLGETRYQFMTLDADMTDFQGLVANLEESWGGVIENTPFEYFTLDDHLNMQYAGDYNTFNLIKYFAFISIIISSLGLYALSMFIAERRFKEIGVRKAMGASIQNIVFMISKDLSLLILIAFVLSIPITIYGMNLWLDTFAFRITPSVTTYLIAGVISILIGWITISYQSIMAARTNPVDVLRDE
jgi:putative ABC transport system permease protein